MPELKLKGQTKILEPDIIVISVCKAYIPFVSNILWDNMHQSTTFDELERFYSIYQPSEIIFITKNYEDQEITDVIQFASIQCPNIHKISLNNKDHASYAHVKNCEKQTYQEELFQHFYQIPDYDTFIHSLQLEEYPIATYSFCFLLEFVQKHNPALVKKIHEPLTDNINNRLMQL